LATDSMGSSFFSESSTYGLWFKRFIDGCHVRMGDQVKQDRALAMAEMLRL
jgi:hypothetical protein